MKCVICKKGVTRQGKTTITLERNGATIVIRHVPARICQNCGEEYVDDQITEKLLQNAEAAVNSGTLVDIREYIAA